MVEKVNQQYLKQKIMIKQNLIDFENQIAEIYKTGKIHGPIHLRDGNEQQLIDIFKNNNIIKDDYVFSTWASHLHALLKGIPKDLILQQILDGNSITLTFPEYNFYTSAIVGGICPIAVGAAWALKQKESINRVFCFIGDMTSYTGIFQECLRYSTNFELPIIFIVEDNGKSVGTPTHTTWGQDIDYRLYTHLKVQYYKYELNYPHAGCGTFIHF